MVQSWVQRGTSILAVWDFGDGGFGGDGRGGVCRPVGKGYVWMVSAPFVDVGRSGEMRAGPPEAVREIDAECRLGRLG